VEYPHGVIDAAVPTMHTLAIGRPRPGTMRMTSLLSAGSYQRDWDEDAIAEQLRFPGVDERDFRVRRFDAAHGIVDIEYTPSHESTMMSRWLDSVEVGTRTRIAPIGAGFGPRFGDGRRVHMFVDEPSIPAARAVLRSWPAGTLGTLWVDTPRPEDVADLPDVDGVSVMSFHTELGFDPLVTAARRMRLDSSVTVWGTGESGRMDEIRAACLAAGLADDHVRVFGYYSRR